MSSDLFIFWKVGTEQGGSAAEFAFEWCTCSNPDARSSYPVHEKRSSVY